MSIICFGITAIFHKFFGFFNMNWKIVFINVVHFMSKCLKVFQSRKYPFSEHSSFLIKIIKIICIYCSLTRNLFYVHLYKCFQVMVQQYQWRNKDVKLLKTLVESGTPIKSIADSWGVSRTTIYRYINTRIASWLFSHDLIIN